MINISKAPKILTTIVICFIILQTFGFLFLKLAYLPTRAAADWPIPDLQIKIPGIENFTKPSPCPSPNQDKMCVTWIAEYISGIYRYAIGVIGILAVVVMMIGGVMWIVAGGNTSRIGEAKAWIGAAVTGLILALSSYLILAQVNPQLVRLKTIEVGEPKIKNDYTTNGELSKSIPCTNNNNNKVYNFNNIYTSSPLPKKCQTTNLNFSGYGIDKEILVSIAAAESGCDPNKISFDEKSCGIMQLTPSTVNKTCEYLINNPQESIKLAAEYIKNNIQAHQLNPPKIFAGYNGGYGKQYGAPLSDSKDCPGALAYECCINPGGLYYTQNYVYNAMRFLNWQKLNN